MELLFGDNNLGFGISEGARPTPPSEFFESFSRATEISSTMRANPKSQI